MATNDVTYGTRTALANVSRIDSIVNGWAVTFGEIIGSGAISEEIHISIPVPAASTGGTFDLYLVESQDGAEWTDNIDPTVDTGDVSGKISDARYLKSSDTTYNVTNRASVRFHVLIPMAASAKFIGFVLVNNSGQTIATGSDGDSVARTIAAA